MGTFPRKGSAVPSLIRGGALWARMVAASIVVALVSSCGGAGEPTRRPMAVQPSSSPPTAASASSLVEPDNTEEKSPPRDVQCVVRWRGRGALYRDEARQALLAQVSIPLPMQASHLRPADDIIHSTLAGQKLIRLEGWMKLADGVGLTTTEELVASSGFVLGAGERLEPSAVRSISEGTVEVRTASGLADPASVEVKVDCSRLTFAPRRTSPGRDYRIVEATGKRLSFGTQPGGKPFLSAVLRPRGLLLEVIERREGFAKVLHRTGPFRLEGWVPVDQVSDDRGQGYGNLCGSTHRTRLPTIRKPGAEVVIARAKREAELRVGVRAEGNRVGAVEANALVILGESEGAHVAFSLLSGAVSAPRGARFWAPRDAFLPVATVRRYDAEYNRRVREERARLIAEEVTRTARCGAT